MQSRVEPLRRVGRSLLRCQHVAHFVVEGARVIFTIEIAALPAPVGPRAGETMEYLLGADFAAGFLFAFGERVEAVFVGDLPPEKRGNVLFLNRFQAHRDSRAAEIFLRHHIAGDLTPAVGNFNSLLTEDHRSVGIADFAGQGMETDALVGRPAIDSEKTPDTHGFPLSPKCNCPPRRQSETGSETGRARPRFRRMSSTFSSELRCRTGAEGPQS